MHPSVEGRNRIWTVGESRVEDGRPRLKSWREITESHSRQVTPGRILDDGPLHAALARKVNPVHYLNQFSSIFTDNLKDPVPKDPANRPRAYNVYVPPSQGPPATPADRKGSTAGDPLHRASYNVGFSSESRRPIFLLRPDRSEDSKTGKRKFKLHPYYLQKAMKQETSTPKLIWRLNK